MNWLAARKLGGVVLTMALGVGLAVPASADELSVNFGPSNALEACVRTAVNVAAPAPVPVSSLNALTQLDCWNLSPTMAVDLTPLAAAPLLSHLYLGHTGSSYQPLTIPASGLDDLWALGASGYEVTSGPTAAAPSLHILSLTRVKAPSIASLTSSTSITELALAADTVASWDTLGGFTALKTLSLEVMDDFDLGKLAPTPTLESIDAYSTPLLGFDALTQMTGLTDLTINGTTGRTITDLAGPAHATSVTTLDLSSNDIVDISAISAMTKLTSLDLRNNHIVDISPISALTKLTDVDLALNDIADPRPALALPLLPTLQLNGNEIVDANNLVTEARSMTAWGQRINMTSVPMCESFMLPEITALPGESATYGNLQSTSSDPHITNPYPAIYMDGRVATVSYYTPTLSGISIDWSTTGAVQTFGTVYVDLDNCFNDASVSVSGDTAWGSVLTATVDAGKATTTADKAYQWSRDGVDIPDATSATYRVTAADAGHSVTVAAALSGWNFAPKTVTSTAVAVPFTLPATVPTVTGSAVVGETLTATPPAYPAGTSVEFQWLRNGVPIAGATQSDYVTTPSDIGKAVAVMVTAAGSGYPPRTANSLGLTVVGTLGAVAKAGRVSAGSSSTAADAGSTLKATSPTFKSPAPTTIKYQWTRNGTPIRGATGSTYKVVAADAGAKITVIFTASRINYTPKNVQAHDIITVRKLFASTRMPAITGTHWVGHTLKAARGTWTPSPATVKYQWYRNGKAIPGATSYKHTLTRSDGGHDIMVKVTGYKSGYTTVVRHSPSVYVNP